MQNRAARILKGNYDCDNTRGIDLVKTLGLMNVSQRRDYFMIILMFKSIHGLVPNYLSDEITMQRDIAYEQRDLRLIIMFMCHILLVNVAKTHLPIEVHFYGMRFQKILRHANRSMVLSDVSNYM